MGNLYDRMEVDVWCIVMFSSHSECARIYKQIMTVNYTSTPIASVHARDIGLSPGQGSLWQGLKEASLLID